MMRFYGLIATHADMKALEANAVVQGTHAVGISQSGQVFKWDDKLRRSVKITNDEAIKMLDVDADTLAQIISSKGKYKVPEPAVEVTPAPKVEEVIEIETAEVEEDEPETEDEAGEYDYDVYDEQVEDAVYTVAELLEAQNKLLAEIAKNTKDLLQAFKSTLVE